MKNEDWRDATRTDLVVGSGQSPGPMSYVMLYKAHHHGWNRGN